MIWLAIGLMTLLALALLLAPLARGGRRPEPGRGAFDLAIFRDQLAEIERDVARGLLAEAEAEAARAEIGRRILAAAGDEPAPAPAAGDEPAPAPAAGDGRRRRLGIATAGALALLLPALALPLYLRLGAPGLPGQPFAERQAELAATEQQEAHNREQLSQLVGQLAERLRAEPDRQEGWLLLARSYQTLGRFADAAAAFRRALALGPAEGARSQLGEALVMAAQGGIGPEALAEFEKAAAEDPGDVRARFFLGLYRMQAGEYQAALDLWRALERDSPAEAPWLPILREHIAAAAQGLGIDPATLAPARPPGEGGGAGLAGGMPTGAEQVAALPPGERAQVIRGMVEGLAKRLAEDPSDAEAWLRLGRAYEVLGEPAKAVGALAEAARHHPRDPRILIAFAAAEAEAAPEAGPLPAPVAPALRTALDLDPGNPEALWLLGLAEARAGRKAEAEGLWRELLAQIPDADPSRARLIERIDALKVR
ncbi:MAG: c-type cytochrome biogenesis protein CcmI [Proteobacteria bacterium]|nr:c-type cytochrome biogenesis protein CcmI [Pseudomonadota bacterium]